MSLTPELEAAFSAANVTVFGCLKIELPGYTLRLLDGAGELVIDGETYRGRDDTWGVVSGIGEFSDGDPSQAPHMTISFTPASDAAAIDLCSPTFQGSLVTLSIGAINRATGQVIPDPYVLFVGEFDVPTLSIAKGERTVTVEVVSALERCFEQDEGARMSDGFHQSVHPGQLGFGFTTADPTSLPWGSTGSRPVVTVSPAPSATDGGLKTLIGVGGFR